MRQRGRKPSAELVAFPVIEHRPQITPPSSLTKVLISTVDALLHRGVLRFAAALSEAGAMREELKDFRRKLSDAGRATYAARTGTHDDMVLALAISAWWLKRPQPAQAQWGTDGTVAHPEYTYGWSGSK